MSEYIVLSSKLENINESFESIQIALNNSWSEESNNLCCLNNTVMEPLYHNLENNMNSLTEGYQKCYNWLDEYVSDLKELERLIQNFSANSLPAPLLFSEKFNQLFDKRVLPILNLQKDKDSNLELGELNRGLSDDQVEAILNVADSQVGITPYWSLHYGPDGEGFGCAMFVSYCYNEALFNGVRGDDGNDEGFLGSTTDFWGNVTNDNKDYHNKGFIEVPAEEAKPGDVVCYTEGTDPYASQDACKHVALYTGNGQIVGSWGYGTREAVGNGPGVTTGTVESQAYGTDGMRDIHYLRYVGEEEKKDL